MSSVSVVAKLAAISAMAKVKVFYGGGGTGSTISIGMMIEVVVNVTVAIPVFETRLEKNGYKMQNKRHRRHRFLC